MKRRIEGLSTALGAYVMPEGVEEGNGESCGFSVLICRHTGSARAIRTLFSTALIEIEKYHFSRKRLKTGGIQIFIAL